MAKGKEVALAHPKIIAAWMRRINLVRRYEDLCEECRDSEIEFDRATDKYGGGKPPAFIKRGKHFDCLLGNGIVLRHTFLKKKK